MNKVNSLQTTPAPITTGRNMNPKGRPRKIQSIVFSTKPKSIVSELIQKMISQKNVKLPIESNSKEYSPNTITHIDELEELQVQSYPSIEAKKKEPKVYSCDFLNCNYSTKLSSNLQKHKRRHTGEKPYLCDRCSFMTTFSNSLKVHKRLHTTERPYHCSSCEYRCNSISNLKKHSRTKHKAKNLGIIETGVITA